ncbi:MAG TPA: 16S rRNA (adenine(1518)-N(6)/adenine(1519)-N(6))-dimethyltransferase RsmA [Terriglobales bacterium]|nr:16S rRNA (adenine(1518)-N(6)/adenine(1519)-N(6))-dimethyltransferase RsmA [Terriglobales bacterium]
MRAPKGQNFLFQEAWQRRVAEAVGPSARLLEIGGGPGGLSALLAKQTERLWVVESDAKLAQGLRQRFAERPSVTVIEADILTVDLTGLSPGEPLRVAGNLPYYITSPILLHLFRHAAAIADATLMVQREVADRLVASPGTRAFGLLTATTQLYARPRRLFDLPPGAFRPAPKVHSSLVRLDFAPRAAELGVEVAPFVAFLRRAFAHKRKQLAGYLVHPGLAGLPAQARAEELSLEQLARLYCVMPVE